ncbi:MAG: lysophospholipid acyltransferase family protein [Chitinophagaceae bacterium]
MKIFLRILQYFYCIYALLLFIILMFIVLPFVLIFALFGKIKGGNLTYKICNVWGVIWYTLIGIRHKEIYEAPHNTNKQYIFLANHISYMDIPAVVRCMHQPVRVLGKYEMVKYPLFGLIYRMAVVIVDRRNAELRARSVRALKSALKQGISIFIFPEGTFNETEKPLKEFYDGAFRIAVETQTPIKPLLFLDTHERMHYRGFFELTPGLSRIVFMKEISVAEYSLKNISLLKQKIFTIMEDGLKKYKPQLFNEIERSKHE